MGLNGLLMESVSKKTISFVQIHVLHDNRHHNAGYTGRQKVKLHKQTKLSNKQKYLSMQLSTLRTARDWSHYYPSHRARVYLPTSCKLDLERKWRQKCGHMCEPNQLFLGLFL